MPARCFGFDVNSAPRDPLSRSRVFLTTLSLSLTACNWGPATVSHYPATDTTGESPRAKIVFLAGRDSHGPLAHEHEAGSQLLAAALQQRQPGVETTLVYGGWPEDETLLQDASALVLYCDGGRGHLINDHLDTFNRLLANGVGVVALHYCVEVPKGSPSATSMLTAIGGYFETDWSVNPHWEADYLQLPKHPTTTGVTHFSLQDEWYFNMRFADNMAGVTPILSAIAPPDTMERSNGPHSGNNAVRKMVAQQQPQITAWAYERDNGGRGFGYTGGHPHANWQDENAHTLVLNAIEWASKLPARDPND